MDGAPPYQRQNGNSGAPFRPPRQPNPFSSSAQSPPLDSYPGGSFAQYASNPPVTQSVSFQVPPNRGNMQRNTDSAESVTKKDFRGMSDRRETGGSGVSTLPELDRSTNALLDTEGGFSGANRNFSRKKSLVRPDRERMDPSHRQWYYRNHAANMDAIDSSGRAAGFSYMPSTTGHLPQHGAAPFGTDLGSLQGPGGGLSGLGMAPSGTRIPVMNQNMPPGGLGRTAPPGAQGGLRRGKSILGRDEDQVESGINILKRGVSLRRRASQQHRKDVPRDLDEGGYQSRIAPGPVGPFMMYSYALTICCPGPFLKIFRIRTPEQQRAWREKIGLISFIILAMAFVGFITFGFTEAVCDTKTTRFNAANVSSGSTAVHGYYYNFNTFYHPNVPPFNKDGPFNHTNPAYSDPWLTGGKDATNLFQITGGACANVLTTTGTGDRYFPCQVYSPLGTAGIQNSSWCHPAAVSNDFLRSNNPMRTGQLFYDWTTLEDPKYNFAVWKGSVLDLNRLVYMTANISKPAIFTDLQTRNTTYAGRDITAMVMRSNQEEVFDCLNQIIRVGFIDSDTIGCVASKVELYVALVFILGVVGIKFIMAVFFAWFMSWRLGNYGNETHEERMKRASEIEEWSEDIYRPAPASYRPNVKKHRSFLPTTSRFSTGYALAQSAPIKGRTVMSEKGSGSRSPSARASRMGLTSPLVSPPGSPVLRGVRSSVSLAQGNRDITSTNGHSSRRSSFSNDAGAHTGVMGACPFPLHNVIPQPPLDYQPFNYPLAHSICLVTAYSESFEGVRTTLDSLATTDYPNSHKMILVIADGIVKGAGSEMSTPDICLSMMKDFVIPPEEVEGNSYVAIADGFKRHNMAKVYAGFYEYDDGTVEKSKQQRVPMVLVAKCGSPLEADSAKPGNRGKRDSQVLLMAFMQKVMFDERMTLFEYEFFNAIWRVTGVSPDHYEIVLMVDADTKVFPDSLSRMVACMVEDPEIMGLCGETKIANKSETWVTMIQVFEYYISHHQTKAFEACFGGVTCLPGCFSAYRIKAPKGPNGYWVPIIANPDIVEHYSENVVDTLHKKNLLLLGEDRYLTTLMLKTFPKRKMMFVPQAVCKTVVPDTFFVLLSQRRRWINSTVHNLWELIQVNDLCGTFCFSMRFVVFVELMGTLVLPAAIAFTLYVVVAAIKAGISSKPIPVIPLVLLGVILGLPGLLIVVTSRKIAYLGWMLIYLLSLPIWNFVFPSYAFWHMDDFSWGATRVIQGDKKGGNHGDAEGRFDSSNIIMKRWAEFERERRWKSGTHSRDSTYDVVHRTNSPERSGSTRYSVVSSDTYNSNPTSMPNDASARILSHQGYETSDAGHSKAGSQAGGARARLDSVPLLELPAPLGPDAGGKPRVNAAGSTNIVPNTPGSYSVPRPRDVSPQQLPPPSPASYNTHSTRSPFSEYPSHSSQAATEDEHRPILSSAANSPDPNEQAARMGLSALASNSNTQQQSIGQMFDPIKHGNVASEQRYPNITEATFAQGFTAEPEEDLDGSAAPGGLHFPVGAPRASSINTANRGFSLVDDGPVASSQGVRQVTRGARRASSNNRG
jgi:chitin synthase